MNERERWVVYPLLFLALGASLRDKLGGRTTTKSIKCEELLVVEEQPLGQEVLLARIGSSDPSNGDGSPGGELLLNGQFAIVNPGPAGPNQTVKKLVQIGRGSQGKGGPSIGYMWLSGEVVVNGPINAMYYVYQGVPFMPALRKALPGLPDFLRAVPEAVGPGQQKAVPLEVPPGQSDSAPDQSQPPQSLQPDSRPPAESADDGSEAAPSP